MDVQYSRPEEQDQQVHEAFEGRKQVRLRLQPDLYYADHGGSRGAYVAWRGVHWKVDCSTPGEALALKEALRTFFTVCGRSGPDRVRHLLESTPLPENP